MSEFKSLGFPTNIMLVCVRLYCKYGISYRGFEEMKSERGFMGEAVSTEAMAGEGRLDPLAAQGGFGRTWTKAFARAVERLIWPVD